MNRWMAVLILCFAILGCYSKQEKTHDAKIGRDSIRKRIISLPEVQSDSLKSQILKRSDQVMTDNGYHLEFLRSEIHEDATNFYVTYRFIKENSKGGGGILVLSKEDLEAVVKYFEE